MFLLDTNVISELRQGKPNQSAEVRNWAAQHRASTLYLSAITILELEKGILLLERRTPPQGAALRVWLTGVRKPLLRDASCHSPSKPLACAPPCTCRTHGQSAMR
jgi:predicted nucleic acid-binding protein